MICPSAIVEEAIISNSLGDGGCETYSTAPPLRWLETHMWVRSHLVDLVVQSECRTRSLPLARQAAMRLGWVYKQGQVCKRSSARD